MRFDYFVKNNSVCPISEANISLFNLEFSYGFGVYETIRVRNFSPQFSDDHIERFFKSANAIDLKHDFKKADIFASMNALVKKLAESRETQSTFNLKLLLIGAKERKDAFFYILPLAPFFPDKKIYIDGCKLVTQQYERWLPEAKTLNMLPSYVYYTGAKNQGGYDVLFIDTRGRIREGSRTNFFAIRGKEIFGAPDNMILAGVMRKHVLKVAAMNGYKVKERSILLGDLKKYDGAFITSASSKIIPVRQVDNFRFKEPAQQILNLMATFDKYLENCDGD